MEWLPVVVIAALAGVITISMLRGGKLGQRWYTGGGSFRDRDDDGTPVEPTDNVRSKQWGGTKID